MTNLTRPIIMGIINATPDSFSDGSSSYLDIDYQVSKAKELIAFGADIIDIGGESTRPGADFISESEELSRVIPIVKELRKTSSVSISIDTNKSVVAEEALKSGANIINDITALGNDKRMLDVVSKYNADLVLMHMQGLPKDMQDSPEYSDTVEEVIFFLKERINLAVKSGISLGKIIIDPGFGFGKSFEDNCRLMQNISRFVELGHQVLIGVSRKSMIDHALNLEVNQRVEASLSLAVMAYQQGAQIFRVHDVKETRRALDMIYHVNQVT